MDLKEQAIEAMIRSSRLHKALIDSVAQTVGMCRTNHIILMMLSRGNLCSQKPIADKIGITPAAVTGALKKLEADGLIERSAGQDNRCNEITITGKGREIAEASKRAFNRIDASLFEDFSEEELAQYIRLLGKMMNAMEKGDGR